MALYTRVMLGFYGHRKTLRLKAALGTDAFWIPPRLWAYAAQNHPDGILENYSAEEIAAVIGYSGDASRMLEAMLQAGFMDDLPLRIHGWEEHNSYHKTFSERAKKGAAARWSKPTGDAVPPHTPPEDTRQDKRGKEPSIAASNASRMLGASPNSLSKVEQIARDRQRREWNDELREVNGELREIGNVNECLAGDPARKRFFELRKRRIELRGLLGRVA